MEQSFIEAEDYEKEFLARYLRKKADKKVKRLREKAAVLENKGEVSATISRIEEKIAQINDELKRNLCALGHQNTEQGSTATFSKCLEGANRHKNHDGSKEKESHMCNSQEHTENIARVETPETYSHVNTATVRGFSVPHDLWSRLFPFQREGVEWMLDLFEKSRGAILADEMGLGKTLQVICVLSSLFLSERIKKALVVSPATVIDHWVSEWKKNYSHVRVCVFHKNKSGNVLNLFTSFSIAGGVGVVSYEGFKSHFKRIQEIDWGYIVLDEGHKIKNQKSHISQYIKSITCKNRIILTGTPMQNNLAELWNLVDFANPSLLGSYETFKLHVEDKIKKAGYSNATQSEILAGEEFSVNLRNTIAPFFLRRSKRDVAAQLPKKTEKMVLCVLTNVQAKMYRDSLNTDSVFKILQGKKNVLCGIDMLRKICNHPYLWSKDPRYLSEENLSWCSGKMKMLNSLLERWWQEGRKALVFSQSVAMLDIIARNCKFRGYAFLRMDGSTGMQERTAFVSRFNSDRSLFVFLLTTKVGGLGLNLVGASRVVIYDPDWNPSADAQAKERVYRYGQVLDVEIYKLICANTIEEKILHTQIFKNLLEKKVFTNARLSRFFNKLDLDELFTYNHEDRGVERVDAQNAVVYCTSNDAFCIHGEDAIGIGTDSIKTNEEDSNTLSN
eukprot:jgi/Antlo1/1627/1840